MLYVLNAAFLQKFPGRYLNPGKMHFNVFKLTRAKIYQQEKKIEKWVLVSKKGIKINTFVSSIRVYKTLHFIIWVS